MLDGVPGPGLRFEARLADGQVGAFAQAVAAILNLGQRVIYFTEQVAIFFHQAKREFLLVVVGAHVGHVEREVREVAVPATLEGFAFHGAHVTDQLAPLGQEHVAEMLELGHAEADLIL